MNQNKIKVKVSVSETLKTAFELWKENFLVIALVMTIVYIPVQLLIEYISNWYINTHGPNYFETYDDLKRFSQELRIYNAIRTLIGVIATLGIFNYVHAILRERKTDEGVSQIIINGLKKWPINFVENLVAGIIIIVYSFLLIIPGIYKAVQYCFISNLVVDDEDDIREKSVLLVNNNWFDVFWMMILIFLISLGLELIAVIPFLFIPDTYILNVLSGILAAVISSYAIVAKGAYYVKLKELKSDAIGNIQIDNNKKVDPIDRSRVEKLKETYSNYSDSELMDISGSTEMTAEARLAAKEILESRKAI